MKVINRAALIRLAILLPVLAALVFLGWRRMVRMPLHSYAGPWVPLTQDEALIRDRLRAHVETLGGAIGERNVFKPTALRAAATLVADAFAETGLEVRRQSYVVAGEQCENLEVEIPGQGNPPEIVVVGAHYDSVIGSPGANDNASGTAGLMELARLFAGTKPQRTLRFVAFANEEPPYFQSAEMGSLVYARKCRERSDPIVAMLSLETIGYYSDHERSQRYPFPLGMFYPSRGNFIGFVGNTESAELVRRCIATFRNHIEFPSEGAALPGRVPGVDWSDHWSFWQFGYPGIMITDTAIFRYPHYHTAQDTPDKLDYDRMTRVVSGMVKVISELAMVDQDVR